MPPVSLSDGCSIVMIICSFVYRNLVLQSYPSPKIQAYDILSCVSLVCCFEALILFID